MTSRAYMIMLKNLCLIKTDVGARRCGKVSSNSKGEDRNKRPGKKCKHALRDVMKGSESRGFVPDRGPRCWGGGEGEGAGKGVRVLKRCHTSVIGRGSLGRGGDIRGRWKH